MDLMILKNKEKYLKDQVHRVKENPYGRHKLKMQNINCNFSWNVTFIIVAKKPGTL